MLKNQVVAVGAHLHPKGPSEKQGTPQHDFLPSGESVGSNNARPWCQDPCLRVQGEGERSSRQTHNFLERENLKNGTWTITGSKLLPRKLKPPCATPDSLLQGQSTTARPFGLTVLGGSYRPTKRGCAYNTSPDPDPSGLRG